MTRIVYASRLMKAREVRQACKAFKQQEAIFNTKRKAAAATTAKEILHII